MSEVVSEVKTKVCEKHGPYVSNYHISPLTKQKLWSGCPECLREYEREYEVQEREQEIRENRKRMERLGITPRFYEATFDTFHAQTAEQKRVLDICREYAESFKPGRALLLCGSVGTGKTHLAMSAVKVIGATRSALYITAIQMLRNIRESYRPNAFYTEQQAIDKYAELDFLALDELGVQLGTESERLLLFEVLDGRYQWRRPTMLVSNLNIADLTRYLGERVIDRMREGGGQVINMTWPSYRKVLREVV